VSLQLQALSNPRIKTAKGFRDALHSLLQTLEESYNVIWQQIMGNDPRAKQIAMCAITWLLCAKKQLSDIQFATAVTLGCQDWSSHINADAALGSKAIFDRASDELVTEEEVLDICDNLIELDHLDKGISVFRLTHLSVREYFEKRREFSQVNMHSLALGTCIHTILSSKRNSFAKKFHHYSWTFWPIHCIELHDKGPWASARDICNQFFRDRSNQSGPRWSWRRNWSRLSPLPLSGIDRLEQIQNSQDSANGIVTIFLFACLFGLMWIFDDLETHPDFNQHLNARSVGARGLILASQYGQHEVVDYLIAKGVSVQSSDESGSALYHAVKNQQKESVLCLLKHGSKTRELDRWKLLMGAITGGNPEIFELLLTNAARVDCPFMLSFSQEGKIHQYLKKATVSPAPIYRILIKHGLFPGNGALRYTIKACDMETLESLLEAGMDPNDRELSGI
jgi:hypothetical protein